MHNGGFDLQDTISLMEFNEFFKPQIRRLFIIICGSAAHHFIIKNLNFNSIISHYEKILQRVCLDDRFNTHRF